MSQTQRTRKIAVIAAGAAVALSTVLLTNRPGMASVRLTLVQSSLRDGAINAKHMAKASERVRLACNSNHCDP